MHRNRAILCDYRARNVTHWSEQEQYENQHRYKYRMRKINLFENELDEEINNQIRMGLNDKTQYEIMQKVSFTNELLNQLRHLTTDKIPTESFNKLENHHEQQVFYSVKTVKYNDSIAQNILRKTCQEINEQDEHEVHLQHLTRHEENETLKFFISKH